MPAGVVALVVVAGLIFFGLAHRALDRMRLTDVQALVFIGLLVAGSFVDIPLTRAPAAISVNVGGAVLPVVLAGYLLARADSAVERLRSLVGAALTAGVVLAVASLTDFDPESGAPIDPLWLFSLTGGLVGYIVGGRSRRAAFIAGSLGLLLTDLVLAVRALAQPIPATVAIGGAGAFDMVVLGGLIAVGVAEAVGETRERLSGGPGPGLQATVAAVVALGVAAAPVRAAQPSTHLPDERLDGGYYTLIDQSTQGVVTLTARVPAAGDGYIDARNVRWEVARVEGDRAWLRRVGLEVMPSGQELATLGTRGRSAGSGEAGGANRPGGADVAIYFTHSDESYVPTSGRSTKPRGDVYQVGETLARTLQQGGYRVAVSPNNHSPHDGQAYLRSRRTAVQLLRRGAGVLVDVHRDSVPPEVYAARLRGRPAVKVRLVVGRQNQNREANLAFAKRLKALADRQLPGAIEGIFLGQGSYNQDLTPRAILLEFGAHTNSLERARTAAELFAPLIPQAAGVGPAAGPQAGRPIGAAAGRALAALVAVTVVGLLAYLAANTPPGRLAERVRELGRRGLARLARLRASLGPGPREGDGGGPGPADIG